MLKKPKQKGVVATKNPLLHNLCGCWLNTYLKILVKVWPCMTSRDARETDAGCRQRKTWRATTCSLPLLTYHFSSFHFISFTIISSNIPTTYLQDTHPNIRRGHWWCVSRCSSSFAVPGGGMPQDDVPQLRHEILLRLRCHSHRELHMLPGADMQEHCKN